MLDFNFVLLHVADSAASAVFYRDLLGSDRFGGSGLRHLAPARRRHAWPVARETVEPKSSGTTGASEISFALADKAAVMALHADWKRRDIPIIQAPAEAGFGTTFVGLDPDGHRLRVVSPPGT